MDALKNIIANVPDWLKRLDDLGTQIDQRQAELAALGVSSTKSIKNRGSTESLKLKDVADADVSRDADQVGDVRETTPPREDKQDAAQPPSPNGSNTPSAIQRQTQQAVAVAQARARAQVKKRHRTDSIISADNAPAKYRTRTMIIVYYDSYVQSFFEELVKFVSASRNLMRKAKMAAKVAQIRRLAELQSPEDEDDGTGELKPGSAADGENNDPLPSLRYMSTRRMGGGPRLPGSSPYSRNSPAGLLGEQEKDAYDDLDKGLEFVQSMCEHAAHQFLRDGDCTEEIGKIKKRLSDSKVLADKEMARVEREDPALLKESGDAVKARTLRPASMRRELTPVKDRTTPASSPMKLEVDDMLVAEKPVPVVAAKVVSPDVTLEADNGPLEADDDEGVEDMEITPPKLQYRSTRMMRRSAV
ncbi:hypothetical protein VD0002_g2353 [Verticillium dahliae]|uniref:Uncharacterized protein n=1 Tax=Verticillium dahliae TaxID=27337 RepID=A0AA44WBB8_VERDA|nr:Rhodanese domain-containing protein [Verticillium dahliae VDG2]KAH6706777.1 hypothetical protein EV126DRAFT_148562 [Verticillium dahliae]PNH27884.1 hypothetical protein BJF96_g8830 [Verticillium dahliae]PNH53480.1 hypothetical protein VD0003_g3929 [Verticillium dahliae]PNH67343.1 hypothetical protein VD0002_g2353 [Verticillium dahliae]